MIYTRSAFYYGYKVTENNQYLAFNEGTGELLAVLTTGKYTLSTLVSQIALAMNAVGTQTYSATVDRDNRVITVSASSGFSLLVSSGSNVNSVFSLLGFTGSDRSSATSHKANLPSGKSYRPQFRLQSFVDFSDNQSAAETTLHKSASGAVELIRFRIDKIMECEIMFITDIFQDISSPIVNNSSGVANAREFLSYGINKGPIEFIPDITDSATFTNCILESTSESSDGLSFRLKEEFNRNLSEYYTTGLLKFREVTL